MSEENNLAITFDNSQLPILEFDFDGVKAELEGELAKYDNIVVTNETLAADKKLAQELSAKGKVFNSQRIEKVRELSAPIKKFEEKMNELKVLCNKAADKIKKQVSVFEDERLRNLEILLVDTLGGLRDEAGIKDEFRKLGVNHLVKLGSLTPKDALAKKAKDALATIVSGELAIQQKVDFRLLQLENESHKAGLDNPLVRINVDHFLLEDDEVYAEKLMAVVQSEVQRQDARKAAEIEATKKAEAIEVKAEPEPVITQEQPVHSPLESVTVDPDLCASTHEEYEQFANQEEVAQQAHVQQDIPAVRDGNVLCFATAVFKVSIPSKVTEQQVADKIVKMLSDAGITVLDSLEVKKHD